MFTGIVQGLATVITIEKKSSAHRLTLDLGKLATGIQLGASISVSGVCLTVAAMIGTCVDVDVMGETLDKTSLGSLSVGDQVNLERSARLGDEIGGHQVSGHVSDTVTIQKIENPPNSWIVSFVVDRKWIPYLLPKGFVALDGCSLTLVDVGQDWFTVHLIPETLARTSFGKKRQGDKVNLEIDSATRAIVDTVKQILNK